MGTRLLEFEGIKLVINQSIVPVELESLPEDQSCLFRCLLSKVISFILSTLYIEHCLLILPLFVAICEIWLPGLTYGVYLVLFLKSGATRAKLHFIIDRTPHLWVRSPRDLRPVTVSQWKSPPSLHQLLHPCLNMPTTKCITLCTRVSIFSQTFSRVLALH